MPLPKTMKGCMRKVKKEFPDGRAKKKMSKKEAHKQHVAMCLNATEGFTFKSFLLNEMATGAKIELDPMSGEDRAKILDVLKKDKLKFENQPGQLIIIDLNRNSIAGSALISHLHRVAQFDDVSEVDDTSWAVRKMKEGYQGSSRQRAWDDVTGRIRRERERFAKEGPNAVQRWKIDAKEAGFKVEEKYDGYRAYDDAGKLVGEFRADHGKWLKGKAEATYEGLDKFAVSSWPVTDAEVERFWEYYESDMDDDEQRELASEEWSDKFTEDQIDDGTFDEFIDHAQDLYKKVHG